MASVISQVGGVPTTVNSFFTTSPVRQAGDRWFVVIMAKGAGVSTPIPDADWVLLKTGTGGTGTLAADTGTMTYFVFAQDVTAGNTASTAQFLKGATAPDTWVYVSVIARPGSGKVWRDPLTTSAGWVQSASDTSTSSPLTGTTGAFTGFQPTAGDVIHVFGGIPTDLGSSLTTGATVTATGLSGGTVTQATTKYAENALGNDIAMMWYSWAGFTGTATAGVTASMVATSATNLSGVIVAMAMRERTISAPPVANAGPDQEVAPGATVNLTAAASTDDVGIASYSWVQTAIISDPPTFVSSQTVADWSVTGAKSLSSPIDVLAGDLVIVFAGAQQGTSFVFAPPTNNGAALTWATRQALNQDTANQNDSASYSTVVDTDRLAANGTALQITMTPTGANSGTIPWGFGVMVFRNHAGIGGTDIENNGSAGSTAPSLSFFTSFLSNTALACFTTDWTGNAAAYTYAQVNGQSPTEDWRGGSAGVAQYTGFHYNNIGTNGSKTPGITSPATQRWVFTALEVKGISRTVTLTGATTSTPSFTAPSIPGAYTFQLTVTDADNQTSTDTVVITVGVHDWLNHVAIASPGSGSTANILDPSNATGGGVVKAGTPFTPTPGRMLVAFAAGGVTFSTPSGWRLPASGGFAVGNSGVYMFIKDVADGSDTVSVTHTGSNWPVGFDIYEFPAGSTVLDTASASGLSASGAPGPTTNPGAGTHWIAAVACRDEPGTLLPTGVWADGTELVDYKIDRISANDGYWYSLAEFNSDTSTSKQAAVTVTGGNGTTLERLMVSISTTPVAGPTAYEGWGVPI